MEPVKLSYARARRRRWPWVVVGAVCLACAMLAGYRLWLRPNWPQIQAWYAMRQCLNYTAPASEAAGQPLCWTRFKDMGSPSTDSVPFLHERRMSDGSRRLVVITAYHYADDRRPRPDEFDPLHRKTQEELEYEKNPDKRPAHYLDFEFYALRTDHPEFHNFDGWLGNPPGRWAMGLAYRFKLCNGQPDPNDRSHFTIVYELDADRGTIDGWLMDDGTVQLKVRDGPALEWVESNGA